MVKMKEQKISTKNKKKDWKMKSIILPFSKDCHNSKGWNKGKLKNESLGWEFFLPKRLPLLKQNDEIRENKRENEFKKKFF